MSESGSGFNSADSGKKRDELLNLDELSSKDKSVAIKFSNQDVIIDALKDEVGVYVLEDVVDENGNLVDDENGEAETKKVYIIKNKK